MITKYVFHNDKLTSLESRKKIECSSLVPLTLFCAGHFWYSLEGTGGDLDL